MAKPPLDKVVRFNGAGEYYPIVYMNDWWNLQEDYRPINATDESLDIHLCFQPISLFRLQLYLSQAYNNEMLGMLGQDAEEAESDKDAMKKMILETQVSAKYQLMTFKRHVNDMYVAMAFSLDDRCFH